jgi:predicted transposase YbfD/YdcC
MKDIHQWAESRLVREMLGKEFGIKKLPCYSHFTNLVGMLNSDALNAIFMEFFQGLVQTVKGKTIAFDGKTVRATINMTEFKSPLHIASAYVVENGITIGQMAADDKSNEIPTVRELLKLLDIQGATITADALNCQKETVETILAGGGEYVLAVKKNHPNLHGDIAEMIEFKKTDACEKRNAPLEKYLQNSKGHGRLEQRIAYVTHEVEWLRERDCWPGLRCIGAVESGKETRYYISSRPLTAGELLDISRQEWMVESMHWQLDVLFNEDRTTLREKNAQKTINILRKTVLNIVRTYRDHFEPKHSMVDIMRMCLFDPHSLLPLLRSFHSLLPDSI